MELVGCYEMIMAVVVLYASVTGLLSMYGISHMVIYILISPCNKEQLYMYINHISHTDMDMSCLQFARLYPLNQRDLPNEQSKADLGLAIPEGVRISYSSIPQPPFYDQLIMHQSYLTGFQCHNYSESQPRQQRVRACARSRGWYRAGARNPKP